MPKSKTYSGPNVCAIKKEKMKRNIAAKTQTHGLFCIKFQYLAKKNILDVWLSDLKHSKL